MQAGLFSSSYQTRQQVITQCTVKVCSRIGLVTDIRISLILLIHKSSSMKDILKRFISSCRMI